MMLRHGQLILLFGIFVTSGCSKSLSHTLEVPKEEIQQKLDKIFPLKANGQEGADTPLDMVFTNPVVLLEEGRNQIGLRVNVLAEMSPTKGPPVLPPGPPVADAPGSPKPRFTGTATLFGTVSFDTRARVILVTEPKITELDIAQLPPPLKEPLSRIAEKALARKFAEDPIPLANETLKDKAVKSHLKSVTVKNGKILIEIGW